jgi:hypothetical protein
MKEDVTARPRGEGGDPEGTNETENDEVSETRHNTAPEDIA